VRDKSVIPGFGLTLGYTLFYMSLIVLLPLSTIFFKSPSLISPEFWATVTSPRVMASYRLSFFTAMAAAGINLISGLIVAWCLVRYRFPGRRFIDALIDLPFAMPTAVAGIALCTIYEKNNWFGWFFYHVFGIEIAYRPAGILVALIFIGLPFIVRTVQPVLQEIDSTQEEAAGSLGAGRWQTFRHVLFPPLIPALLTGFSLAFARAVGEYGSVIFIAGNIPMVSEITPLMIITKLEQFDYPGASAVAVSMLAISFVILLSVNTVQHVVARRYGRI
jgi:sulfate transport system permease protein